MLDLKPGRSCKRGWETLPPAFPCRLGSQTGSSICGRSLVAVGGRSLLTAGAIVGTIGLSAPQLFDILNTGKGAGGGFA